MNDDDLTTDLGRALRDHSDAMHGTSLALADVQHKARSIRRRRAATAVGGAVAAIALIVPTAALANHTGRSIEPLPATQSVTPTPSPTTSEGRQPPTGVLDVSHLPTGAAPATDYVYQGRLHLTDGSTGEVNTRYSPRDFVELADGARVWQTTDQGTPYIEIQDSDGSFHDPLRSGSGLSVNRPHSIAAWLTPAGQVMIWEGWASEPRPLGYPVPGTGLRLGPITGSGTAPPGQPGPDCRQFQCAVMVNITDTTHQPWKVSEGSSEPLPVDGFVVINDVSAAGLTIGLIEIHDTSTCSRLQGGGEVAGFKTCTNQLASFSPDGKLIAALPGYFDGAGPGGFAMIGLDGTILFDRRSTAKAQATLADNDAVWEDAIHVLVPVYQEGSWSLVRIASDGSMEYAVSPTRGADVTDDPFVLPTGGGMTS